MHITPYEPGMAEQLRHAYYGLFKDVPHCWEVAPEPWQKTLDTIAGQPTLEPPEPRQALVARQGDQIIGYVYYGLRPDGPPRDDGQLHIYQNGPLGTMGCFWYLPGHLRAGRALLRLAEHALKQLGARTMRAFHYDETLPFYHLEHAYLSSHLAHIEAVLGLAGFRPSQGETSLAWQNMAPQPLASPLDLRLDPQWDNTRASPALVLRALDQDEQVGICVAKAAFPHAPQADAQAWLYTPWLAVSPQMQRQGIGRWLLLSALEMMTQQGYRHAAICCISDNYPALGLYSNLGYRVTDQTRVWIKQLD